MANQDSEENASDFSAESSPETELGQVDSQDSSTPLRVSRQTGSSLNLSSLTRLAQIPRGRSRPTNNASPSNNSQKSSQLSLSESSQTGLVASDDSDLPEEFKHSFLTKEEEEKEENPFQEPSSNGEMASGNNSLSQPVASKTSKQTLSPKLPRSSFTARSGRRTQRGLASSLPSSNPKREGSFKVEVSSQDKESPENDDLDTSPQNASTPIGNSLKAEDQEQKVAVKKSENKGKAKVKKVGSQTNDFKGLSLVLNRIGKALGLEKKKQASKSKPVQTKLVKNVRTPTSFNKKPHSLQANFQGKRVQHISLARNYQAGSLERGSGFSHQSIFTKMSEFIQHSCLQEEINCH